MKASLWIFICGSTLHHSRAQRPCIWFKILWGWRGIFVIEVRTTLIIYLHMLYFVQLKICLFHFYHHNKQPKLFLYVKWPCPNVFILFKNDTCCELLLSSQIIWTLSLHCMFYAVVVMMAGYEAGDGLKY